LILSVRSLRRASASALLATVVTFALPAVAVAGLVTVGSLGAAARTAFPEPVDTAFWVSERRGGGSAGLPHAGLVKIVRLRGCAEPGPQGQTPLTQIHFQTLAPGAGGNVTIKLTTGPFNVPICGRGASAATVTSFVPLDLCAAKGDYVAFNVEGGFGPGFPTGVSYEDFGHAAGAVTDSFTGAGQTNNGATITATPHPGVRLLMAVVLGTGSAARVCR
jgi:hypothetical protein